MSQRHKPGAQHRAQSIKRRIQSEIIEMPALPARQSLPHVRQHSKSFAMALLAIVLLGALLLATPWTTESGTRSHPIDAVFTSVSATSVTGLVTVDTQTHWNFLGELIILLLVQLGGLGFMVGASIVLQMLRRGQARLSDQLMMQDGAPTLSLREAVEMSRRIVWFTLTVEGIGALVLAIRFSRDMPVHDALWQGVFYAVCAFCNAGFDLTGHFQSLIPYRTSPVINVAIILLIQAGALSYIVFEDIYQKRRWSKFNIDTKLVLLVHAVILAGGAGIFLFAEWSSTLQETPIWARPMSALFQSVSARSGGYATVDWADARVVTVFIWVGIMFVGGASASTAGGVKLSTVGVIAASVYSTIVGREDVNLYGRRIAAPIVFRGMAVVAIMMSVHFLGTIALAVTENVIRNSDATFQALMFEAMSGLGTVGLSNGITPTLSTPGKLVLCAIMFFGRLGPLTAVYALQRRQRKPRFRYPVAPIRIG